MFKHILTATLFVTCLGAGTAFAHGKSDEARPAKTDADRASQTGQDNRSPNAEARSDNRDDDNAGDESGQRRKFKKLEKLPPAEAEPLELLDETDPCPNIGDCL